MESRGRRAKGCGKPVPRWELTAHALHVLSRTCSVTWASGLPPGGSPSQQRPTRGLQGFHLALLVLWLFSDPCDLHGCLDVGCGTRKAPQATQGLLRLRRKKGVGTRPQISSLGAPTTQRALPQASLTQIPPLSESWRCWLYGHQWLLVRLVPLLTKTSLLSFLRRSQLWQEKLVNVL